MADKLITTKELSRKLGIAYKNLTEYVMRHNIKHTMTVGNAKLWAPEQINTLMEHRKNNQNVKLGVDLD